MIKNQVIILSLLFVNMTSFASEDLIKDLPGEISIFNSNEFKNKEKANQDAHIRAQAARAKAELEEIAIIKDRKNKAFQVKLNKALAQGLLEDAEIINRRLIEGQDVDCYVKLECNKISWNEEIPCICFSRKSPPQCISLKISECSSPTSVAEVSIPEFCGIKFSPAKNFRTRNVFLPLSFVMSDSMKTLKITPAKEKMKSCLKRMQELD